MSSNEPRVALLAGASGLVGGYVLDSLLDAPDFSRVFAISRRPLGREHSRLANRIVQFDKLESQLKGTACHVAFCCLGTTLKQAGSEAAFRQVDFDYALAFARAARVAQAQRFVVVSSAGANPESKNFYLRVKGEMERALAELTGARFGRDPEVNDDSLDSNLESGVRAARNLRNEYGWRAQKLRAFHRATAEFRERVWAH